MRVLVEAPFLESSLPGNKRGSCSGIPYSQDVRLLAHREAEPPSARWWKESAPRRGFAGTEGVPDVRRPGARELDAIRRFRVVDSSGAAVSKGCRASATWYERISRGVMETPATANSASAAQQLLCQFAGYLQCAPII